MWVGYRPKGSEFLNVSSWRWRKKANNLAEYTFNADLINCNGRGGGPDANLRRRRRAEVHWKARSARHGAPAALYASGGRPHIPALSTTLIIGEYRALCQINNRVQGILSGWRTTKLLIQGNVWYRGPFKLLFVNLPELLWKIMYLVEFNFENHFFDFD